MKLISTFGERLNTAINESGLQQIQVAKLAGISKSLLNKYIKGIATAKNDKLYNLSLVLKVNPVWLLGYDVNKKDNYIDENNIIKSEGSISISHSVKDILDMLNNCSINQFFDVLLLLNFPKEQYHRISNLTGDSLTEKKLNLFNKIFSMNDKDLEQVEKFINAFILDNK